MIQTIERMAASGDQSSVNSLWELLGGGKDLPPGDAGSELVIEMIRDLCGKGERYVVERNAVAQVAETLGVATERYADIDSLEDAVLEALVERLRERLVKMTKEERRQFFADMVKRMPDDERVRLIEQVLFGFEQLPDEAREEFVRELAREFDIDEADMAKAIAGGAAALLSLLAAKEAGFAVFLWTTNVMYAASSAIGLTIPFAAYQAKNVLLGALLGPVGLIATTALTLGWFGHRQWRRKERFRKLVQIIAFCSTWRAANTGGDTAPSDP